MSYDNRRGNYPRGLSEIGTSAGGAVRAIRGWPGIRGCHAE